jgi:ribonuclease HII
VIIVGVDENGLGPLLGPLVTTAVSLELKRYRPEHHAELGRALGIDDSKATAGFGQMALAEGLALALIEALTGALPTDIDALFEALLLDPPAALRAPCPSGSRPQCWSVQLALPCFGGDVSAGRLALRKLRKAGLRPLHVRSALACAGSLNSRLRKGQSRVEVDLELMERLVIDARASAAEDVRAICGMVGGIRNYLAKMRHFPALGIEPARSRDLRTEKAGALAYEVRGVGHVRFEIDADTNHLPVALASMVGKYVRELSMARQNRFYRQHDDALADVSGYHDPVTQRFILASSALRTRLGIDDACFRRQAAKDLTAVDAHAQLSLL